MKAKNHQKKLQARINDYVRMRAAQAGNVPAGAYHCPGSNKK